jgi:hypothetical protein
MKVRFWVPLFFYLIVVVAAQAQTPPYDFVYDLDWTLFYPVKTKIDSKTILVDGVYYRLSDGVVETLGQQFKNGDRVSIFSGGELVRNQMLAKFIARKIRKSGVRNFEFYKILGREDLTARPGTDEEDSFADRWMKDLTKISLDLSHMTLIDDNPKFAAPGQESNMYGLGKTYTFYSAFDPSAHGTYDPPSFTEWRRERNKIRDFGKSFQKTRCAEIF